MFNQIFVGVVLMRNWLNPANLTSHTAIKFSILDTDCSNLAILVSLDELSERYLAVRVSITGAESHLDH